MIQNIAAFARQSIASLCIFLMASPAGAMFPPAGAQDPQDQSQSQGAPQDAQQNQAPDQPQLTPAQLDDLVTPIALYADPLIAQILAAATYPLEVVQADRWLQSNSQLQGTALTQAAAQQNWDPSVQALVVFPSVLSMMDKNLTWTTDLGNAFLAQEQDVMDAVQRQRKRAYDSGKLQSTPQQTVERSNDNGQQVIVIQPPQPNVIYVPVYDPVAIWGPPAWYPWGPFWYPPRPRYGLVVGAGFGFFIGVGVSSYFNHWGGWGGWGWGCGWRGRNVVINNNFYVVNNYRAPRGIVRNGSSVWAHNPQHRAGVPYPSRQVANRVGYRLPPGRPGSRPGGNQNFRPGDRPQQGRPVAGGRPGEQPGRPGGNQGRPVNETRPGNQVRPGNPGGRPGNDYRPGNQTRPGGGQTRPAPRPTDRSALNGVQTPGDRAQIERARGYGSLGNRAPSQPSARPSPQRNESRPQSRPSGGKPR
jgi:hypothetical protein